MAAFTWTKGKCDLCGRIERYRGKHGAILHHCCCGGTVRSTEIHWGREKYAQGRTGVTKLGVGEP